MKALQTKPFSLTQTIAVAGEGGLRLLARAPGCDWSRRGAESAVATIAVDGTPTAELVLHRGEELAEYFVALGHLERGTVQLTVTFRPELSPVGAREVQVHDATVTTIPATHPDYLLWRYAPRLYGRPDNATTDTPLLLLARIRPEGALLRLAYAYVWSDQDADRSVMQRLAQDGTPVDIDWVYELYLDRRTGRVPKAVVQGAGQTTDPLLSRTIAGHPVLATATRNNMVSLKGASPLLFSLPPIWAYDETRGARERALDAFPWALSLAEKEQRREAGAAAIDPRNYLYVDFKATLAPGTLLAAQATLRNRQVLSSDYNNPTLTVFRNGWSRTAIPLPPGTTAQQLAGIGFVRRDKNTEPYRIEGVTLHLLDNEFRPQPLILPTITQASSGAF